VVLVLVVVLGLPALPLRDSPVPCHGADAGCLRRLYARPAAQWPRPWVDADVAWQELATVPWRPPPSVGTSEAALVALGGRLFAEPLLSRQRDVSCQSCHLPALAGADGRAVSVGTGGRLGRRNAPSVQWSALAPVLMWDGRFDSLEAQALHPIEDPREMGFTVAGALRRLQADARYRAAFAQAFGSAGIDAARLRRALAAYQRSLLPAPSRYDRFMAGQADALGDAELRGLHLFRTKARCMNCHGGMALSDGGFHDLGLAFFGREQQDLGRYEATGVGVDAGRFRTPGLRGVSRTGPWMHNGVFDDLVDVLHAYNAGMFPVAARGDEPDDMPVPRGSPLLQPLQLQAEEIEDLQAFLEVL